MFRVDGEMYLATPLFKTVRKVGGISKVLVTCSKSVLERGSGNFPFVAQSDMKALHGLLVAVLVGCNDSYTIQTSNPT